MVLDLAFMVHGYDDVAFFVSPVDIAVRLDDLFQGSKRSGGIPN
jgi:hypothetical protein